MSDALVGGEKEAPALTNVEIEILQSASEEKIRKIEQDAANRVHLETRLETMIQSCLAVKANTQLYTDVFRQCAAVTDIIADGVSVQKQTDDLAVRYVNALLGYTDLQTYYSQKIESLQNKVVNFEIEVQRLETLIQKGIRNDHVPEVALKLACLMKTEKHGETDPLIKILTDLICNRGKESKTWSDETKSLFAIILNYGAQLWPKLLEQDWVDHTSQRSTGKAEAVMSFQRSSPINLFRWLESFTKRLVTLGHLFLQSMLQL